MTANTAIKLTQRQQAYLFFALAMLANGLALVSLFRGVNTAIAAGVTCLLWVVTYVSFKHAWACWDAASASASANPSAPAREPS